VLESILSNNEAAGVTHQDRLILNGSGKDFPSKRHEARADTCRRSDSGYLTHTN
jgi:hypothetical protein